MFFRAAGGWIRFSAEKPGWLQQSTGLLPRAAFRIQFVLTHKCSHTHTAKKFIQTKKTSVWMSFLFIGGSGWIRTIEVTDNRFTVCPLWPLGNTPTKKWSWWTDLNPRPADYKSAALPTELHQLILFNFLRYPLALNYNSTQNIKCQHFF